MNPSLSATIEATLLHHVPLCFAVAFALTKNTGDARRLTRDLLTWAWEHREEVEAAPNVKVRLLTELRRHYLAYYQRIRAFRATHTVAQVRRAETASDVIRAERPRVVAKR